MAVQYAFVTLLTSDSYLPGALALAGALKDVHPSPVVHPEVEFQTVCLVTPETVDISTVKLLRRAYNVVIGVEVIDQQDNKGLKLLGRLDLDTVLTKLHIFRLTQYTKIIFLDADVLPIRPLSHLFTLPHEFSAAPDVGWPDIFNSGVLVVSPGEDKFSELTQLLKTKGTWDGGDQGILNEWRGNNWNRLSFTYNTTPTAAYTYAPAYERFGSQISAIHFIGPNKPWSVLPYRSPFTFNQASAADSSQQAYDYSSLVDRWFTVYDSHYRSEVLSPEVQFEVKRYASAWNEERKDDRRDSSPKPPKPPGPSGVLSLEELRRVAIEGLSKSGMSSSGYREGEYRSMPLEGRVDLLRPPKPRDQIPEEQEEEQEAAGRQSDQGGPTQVQMGKPRHETYQATSSSETNMSTGDSVWTEEQDLAHTWPESSQETRVHTVSPSLNILSPQENSDKREWQISYSVHQRQSGSEGHISPGSPTTPPVRQTQLPGGSPVRWHTPPPPDPAEIPSSPRLHVLPLPSTPTPQPNHRHYLKHGEVSPHGSPSRQKHQHVEHHHQAGNSEQEPQSRRDPIPQQQRHASQEHGNYGSYHHRQGEHIRDGSQESHHHQSPRGHHHSQLSHQDPPRPRSPPMLIWNPAIEPPPNATPASSAFPSDTYFTNIWDKSPSKQDQPRQVGGSTSPVPDSHSFFQPPPTPEIPVSLRREGHYRRVTGEDNFGSTPSPDPTKVKVVFPWEEKPRQMPARAFPAADAPSPTLFLSPVSQTSPSSAPSTPEPPTPRIPILSPLHSLSSTLTYSNAWDHVPSIQQYASKLVRPPTPPTPLAPPFNAEGWGKKADGFKSWGEKGGASSRDGDDEDDGDDKDEDSPAGGNSSRRSSNSRSRSGSVSGSFTYKGKTYRGRGVQTTNPEMKSQAIQVTAAPPPVPPLPLPLARKTPSYEKIASPHPNIFMGKRPWPSASGSGLLSPITMNEISAGPDLSMTTAAPSPASSFERLRVSPVSVTAPKSPQQAVISSPMVSRPLKRVSTPPRNTPSMKITTPPTKTSTPIVNVKTPPMNLGVKTPRSTQAISRRASVDSPLASPASSLGPASSPDGQTIESPLKKAGRVWDPARGVELFKRGSEEVLARFLKMRSWEDETPH